MFFTRKICVFHGKYMLISWKICFSPGKTCVFHRKYVFHPKKTSFSPDIQRNSIFPPEADMPQPRILMMPSPCNAKLVQAQRKELLKTWASHDGRKWAPPFSKLPDNVHPHSHKPRLLHRISCTVLYRKGNFTKHKNGALTKYVHLP